MKVWHAKEKCLTCEKSFFFCRLGEVCKHVGALLHHIASEVRKGKNKTYASLPQTWGHPSVGTRKKYGPRKLSDIRVKKAKNRARSFLCTREQQSVDRSSFDPRSLKDRTPMHFADIDWENLALASNGNCGSCCIKIPIYHLQVRNQILVMLFKKKLCQPKRLKNQCL